MGVEAVGGKRDCKGEREKGSGKMLLDWVETSLYLIVIIIIISDFAIFVI